MAQANLNRLTCSLRDLCNAHVLEEKWLIAPSWHVGFQWLGVVARSGQPVLNVRVKRLRDMAMDLASKEIASKSLRVIQPVQAEVMVSRIFGELKESEGGYLSGLDPSPGLTRTLYRTVCDLRLAGLTARSLSKEAFEVQRKGLEIRNILKAYEALLKRERFVDYADLLRMAKAELRKNPAVLPAGLLVLIPENMLSAGCRLEKDLWETLPAEIRKILKNDPGGEIPDSGWTDAAILPWLLKPNDAPSPGNDGTVGFFRAAGEVNEIRNILRRCLEEGVPFDDVEILYTDSASYLPLIYEIASCFAPDGHESLPVTFAEGILTRYSHPARALRGWLSWTGEDFPQSTLARMIQDGLLKDSQFDMEAYGFDRLAAIFRTVPIGQGKHRYLPLMDGKIASLKARIEGEPGSDEDFNDVPSDKKDRDILRREGLKALRDLAGQLLAEAPEKESSQNKFLESAVTFLEKHARCTNPFDTYSRKRFLRAITTLAGSLEKVDVAGLDIRAWLAELSQSAQEQDREPRPGCFYAAPIRDGGHSGRKHTFIVGLDDSRFPGAALQNPLLLDAECSAISSDIPTAAGRLADNVQNFLGLLARLRGHVILSYCCRDLEEDREMFPSPLMLAAYRMLSGNREGTQKDFLAWLPDPVSFIPGTAGRCLDSNEWWLWRLVGGKAVEDPEAVITGSFPHLGRGLLARRARESNAFTEYDGRISIAREDNPFEPEGPVLSASRLETLGKCPMEYFFRHILKIERPEEYVIDFHAWLDPMEKGKLLHYVFREFMSRLHNENRLPDFKRDFARLQDILNTAIDAWRKEFPPPNQDIFEREQRELHQTVRIFLMEEEKFCRSSRPVFFEAGIGLPPEGDGTILDVFEPPRIRLPGGRTIRARGRIDRIDEAGAQGGNAFSIWDYKTGSSGPYRRDRVRKEKDPFNRGRLVQSALYPALAEARLKQAVSRDAKVVRFGYFFPNHYEHGDRISWPAGELKKGKEMMAELCTLIAEGCFPFTDDPEDVFNSDYQGAFGDVNAAGNAIKRKLSAGETSQLEPFRRLRGYTEDDDAEKD